MSASISLAVLFAHSFFVMVQRLKQDGLTNPELTQSERAT